MIVCRCRCREVDIEEFRISIRARERPRRSAKPAQSPRDFDVSSLRKTQHTSFATVQVSIIWSPRKLDGVMDALWDDFAKAQNDEDGYLLAATITPEPPTSDPARLYNFSRWTNDYSVQTDLRYKLQYNPALHLGKKEAGVWLDIFTAFYHFTGKLLAAEEAQNAGKPREADWSSVYESWKDVMSAVYRSYSGNVLEVWTIPCLYVIGKYLRIFATKADESAAASQRDGGLAFGGLQEEDAFNATSKNEKLEDAARQINRIFALCLGDRYVTRSSIRLCISSKTRRMSTS